MGRRLRKGDEYLYGKGPVKAAMIRIARNANRTKKQAIRLKTYGVPCKASLHLEEAVRQLQLAAAELETVPKDWKPMRGTLSAPPIDAGMHVRVRSFVADRYEGVFDVDKELLVTEIRGTRLVCETTYRGQKVRVAMPRSHAMLSGGGS